MEKKITIAIDGTSSSGKSTLAKQIAKELHYIYVDSGAMYRGVTLYMMRKNLVSETSIETDKIVQSLSEITLSFKLDENNNLNLYLNGENVEKEIRTMEVSNLVSSIATVKEVRYFLVAQQREIGKEGGIVMDGRDIGSVVFPKAELKIFLLCSDEVRVQRRYNELLRKGQKVTLEEVTNNLKLRDETDANREISPLIQTEDAELIDNSDMSMEETLATALKLINKRINSIV